MHCCLQDYAVTLTDALADLLAHPAVLYSIDQHATGYSRGDLQSLLEQLPYGLLHDIMDIPVAQQCWHNLGQHLFPFCAQMFVSVARDYMRKSERALTACPQLELFVHMLGDCHMLNACIGFVQWLLPGTMSAGQPALMCINTTLVKSVA